MSKTRGFVSFAAAFAISATALVPAPVAPATAFAQVPTAVVSGEPVDRADRPIALVYRGPASCEGCAEAVVRLLKSSRHKFRVFYVGPREHRKLVPKSFVGVTLYAQPGGGLSVAQADRAVGEVGKAAIESFVRQGGRYLGFCEGAYLAGKDPGIGLLSPGDTRQYITSSGATVHNARDSLVRIKWGKQWRWMFFQDGPIILASGVPGERILARYTNRRIAALTKPYGAGRIGVVGPHPEAERDWYSLALWRRDRDQLDHEFGLRLINQTMR